MHSRFVRAADAGARACRSHVGIEIELDGKGGGNVDTALVARRIVEVRNGTEQDAVRLGSAIEDGVGKRGAGFGGRRKPDFIVFEYETKREQTVEFFQNMQRCGGDLGADAIAGQYKNFHEPIQQDACVFNVLNLMVSDLRLAIGTPGSNSSEQDVAGARV